MATKPRKFFRAKKLTDSGLRNRTRSHSFMALNGASNEYYCLLSFCCWKAKNEDIIYCLLCRNSHSIKQTHYALSYSHTFCQPNLSYISRWHTKYYKRAVFFLNQNKKSTLIYTLKHQRWSTDGSVLACGIQHSGQTPSKWVHFFGSRAPISGT